MAFGRRSEIRDLDAIALSVEQLEIFDDLVPMSELAIGAELEAEELIGRCDVVGRGRGRRDGEKCYENTILILFPNSVPLFL